LPKHIPANTHATPSYDFSLTCLKTYHSAEMREGHGLLKV
jgi:hypothetical protein